MLSLLMIADELFVMKTKTKNIKNKRNLNIELILLLIELIYFMND